MEFMDHTSADFYLDPLCPWSWATAQWLAEVQRHRPLDVRWHVMSLAILNEDTEVAPEWVPFLAESWGPVRVIEGAAQLVGDEAVFPLIDAIGRRVHVDERRDYDAILRESVEECGLPVSVAELAWTTDMDEDVRLSHKTAVALSGPDVGSPVLAIRRTDGEQVGFYGPVISQIPRGEDAARMWDGFVALADAPGFFELKRTRDQELNFA
jgi:protein-disulfide isomerase-like protein with CxxC motif